jgi:hypothetical protein
MFMIEIIKGENSSDYNERSLGQDDLVFPDFELFFLL